MSYLEQLLEGVEVEWKKIGDVCDVFTGGEAPKNSIKGSKPNDTFKYPIYGNGAEIYGYADSYRIEKDAVTISSIGAKTGTVYFREAFFTPIIRLKVLIPKNQNLLPRFIFHFLSSISIGSKKSSVPNMNASDVKKLQIPIPPLSVQKEIVRILDTFTRLTAKLKTELNARKKQFTHYHDQLLSFEDKDVEWKTLGDIGNVRMCKRVLKKQTNTSGDIPFYKIGTFGKKPDAFITRELFEEFKEKYNYPKIGDVLISASGTIGRTVTFDGQDSYFQDSNIVWIENDESQVLNTYLSHYYKIAKWHTAKGGTISRLYNDNLKKTAIPVPSFEEQNRIVSILDKFDTLTNSQSEGLPAEIQMRQKQFEYYRDMLLTFPKDKIEA